MSSGSSKRSKSVHSFFDLYPLRKDCRYCNGEETLNPQDFMAFAIKFILASASMPIWRIPDYKVDSYFEIRVLSHPNPDIGCSVFGEKSLCTVGFDSGSGIIHWVKCQLPRKPRHTRHWGYFHVFHLWVRAHGFECSSKSNTINEGVGVSNLFKRAGAGRHNG